MATRYLHATSTTEAEDELEVVLIQQPKWCVNVYGHAMEHRIKDRGPLRIARGRAGLKGGWGTFVAADDVSTGKKKSYAKISRPLALSASESVSSSDDETQLFLIVGIAPAPSMLRKEHFTKAIMTSTSKGYAIGGSHPKHQHRIHWLDEEPPMLIGYPLPDNGSIENQKVNLYALLDPNEDGLCTAYKVKQAHVFFFSEFRDIETDRQRREGSWNGNVFRAALRLVGSDTEASNAVEEIARVDDSVLHKFISVEDRFGKDDAIDFVKEFRRRWSGFEKLDQHFVLALRRDYLLSEIKVEFHFIRSYVREGMRIVEHKRGFEEHGNIGERCLKRARWYPTTL